MKPIIILGEKATGKTELANEIAKRKGGEIVVADKFYIYDFFERSVGLDKDEYEVLTHLLGGTDPEKRIPRSDYSNMAMKRIENIQSAEKLPIVEGCSFGYVTSLLERDMDPLIFGLRYPNKMYPREKYLREINIHLKNGAIGEVEKAMLQGLGDTYIMNKSIYCSNIKRYIKGEVDLNLAIRLIVEDFVDSVKKSRKSFENLEEDVFWIDSTKKIDEKIDFVERKLEQS